VNRITLVQSICPNIFKQDFQGMQFPNRRQNWKIAGSAGFGLSGILIPNL
jgi:hypothetical protein